MKCPACGSEKSRVYETRRSQGGLAKKRRHRCEQCDERFTTLEVMIDAGDRLIKLRPGYGETYYLNRLK